MGSGVYTAPERVERDGYLVCFAGERMTMAEAERRGLVEPGQPDGSEPAEAATDAEPADAAALEARAADLVATMKAVELRAMAADLGCEVPDGATKAVLAAAIAAAEAAGA